MKNLAVIYDETHLKHAPPFSHPERPERVSAIYNFLTEKIFFDNVDLIKPSKSLKENILCVHTNAHYNFITESIIKGRSQLDEDTYIVKDSLEAALLSAGGVIKAVDLIMNESYSSVFSLMRPPGHHAESNRPMGFCIFNNIAVGAKYALEKYNLNRIAVIDWDVHHGNGTQQIFYFTPEVLFISLHQFPFYPGTGSENEKGEGSGMGFTLNFPLPAGTTGEIYLRIFRDKIIKALYEYDPHLLFISAGFDAHKDDPLANMELTEEDFGEMTRLVKQFADKKNIKIISVLEGGYNLYALARSVYTHLNVLNESL
jgi:acetoin utilization deacetylase AcuC-like enzyme